MAWEELRTDYADAVFDGLRKYMVTENPDGSYSFSDVTQYTVRENSFIGAKDINAMNTAMNLIMAALNDGTDLYDVFTQFFIEQQELFASSADDYQNDFKNYLGELRIAIMDQCEQLKNDYTGDITKFKELQKAVYEEWFAMIKASLSENAAGKLLLQLEDHKSNEEIHITGVEREAWNGKMEPDGDSAENTVTFESGDTEDPAVWADVGVIESGEKHGSLFRKISLAVRNTRFLKKMLEKLNTDLSDTNTELQGKAPSDHTHDGRYYTESEVNNLLGSLGPFNPRSTKLIVGSRYIILQEGARLAYEIVGLDKNIHQFMPFLSYNDSCFNCPVHITSSINGKTAQVCLVPQNPAQTAYGYNIWYLAVTDK